MPKGARLTTLLNKIDLSLWTGGSDDSWFDYDRLSAYRRLNNPETKARKPKPNEKFFYLISVDVARIVCQTVCSVFKVSLGSRTRINLVNMYVLGKTAESKDFEVQAADLKRIIAAFQPKEVVIDGNGLGIGLLEFMTKTQVTNNNEVFHPIGSFNDTDLMATQPKDAPKLIYVLKANSSLNSKIHANCFAKMASGSVNLLIKEQEAKIALMNTEVGKRMKPAKRIERLIPHQLTTILLEEMCNLRLKKNVVSTDIALESVNRRMGKDKFSSFEYGLWRIKELEDANEKRRGKSVAGKRRLIFYSSGEI